MPRPANKDGILKASRDSFDRLFELVETVPEDERISSGVNGEWSIKDVLAHLHARHSLMETWYIEGMAGNKPAMPARGYTWNTISDLNDRIFREHNHEPMELVVSYLLKLSLRNA